MTNKTLSSLNCELNIIPFVVLELRTEHYSFCRPGTASVASGIRDPEAKKDRDWGFILLRNMLGHKVEKFGLKVLWVKERR